MSASGPTDLRLRLRCDTRAAHEQLDAVVSRFELTTAEGLGRFMTLHARCLTAILSSNPQCRAHAMLSDLRNRAQHDAVTLCAPMATGACHAPASHDLAIDYVMAGSRLGSAVLKRRWQGATVHDVRAADAYFTAPDYISNWMSFCAMAGAEPATGAAADRVVGDARALLDLYARQAAMLLPQEDLTDA